MKLILECADALSLNTYVTVSSTHNFCTVLTFYSNTMFVNTFNHKLMNKRSIFKNKKILFELN